LNNSFSKWGRYWFAVEKQPFSRLVRFTRSEKRVVTEEDGEYEEKKYILKKKDNIFRKKKCVVPAFHSVRSELFLGLSRSKQNKNVREWPISPTVFCFENISLFAIRADFTSPFYFLSLLPMLI